jgi:tRNA modification GTPase
MDGATIIALSSGAPPAAIGVIRISGGRAGDALAKLCGTVPPERRATLRTIRHPDSGEILDSALLLWFPGPRTATGEDLGEIHVHGGRAVVAAVLDALMLLEGVRLAEPGEFTRRAFANGVIDLAQAEGLADLLSAETESQRRNAQLLAGGGLSRRVAGWQDRLLGLSARIEAYLEFGDDEGDVGEEEPALQRDLAGLASEIEQELVRPGVERLKDGIRVVLAGPPNAGKSTLLNALVEREAAITSATPGTTRDLIQAPVSIGGVPLLFVDTAGLRETGTDEIEDRGIVLARRAVEEADILLWLGEPREAPVHARRILLHARCDATDRQSAPQFADLSISARTGQGLPELGSRVLQMSAGLIPNGSDLALNRRQRDVLAQAHEFVRRTASVLDPVLRAEELRGARTTLDRLTGRAGTEEMLDALFERFCIGK